VLEHLRAENTYFEALTGHTAPLRKALYDEMLARIQQTDLSAPYREHGYWYYTRTVEGKPYTIYCRRKGTMEAPEEVTLDVNELASGKSFLIARAIAVSPDSRILAYGEDPTGGRRFTIRFKNLETGKLLPDAIENARATWCGTTTRGQWPTPRSTRLSVPTKAWRRRLGDAPSESLLLHNETDEKYSVDLHRTLSEKYIFMTLANMKTTEVWFASADAPASDFRCFSPRKEGLEYRVDHARDSFLITHNENAINFQIAEAPESQPEKANWKTIIAHDPGVYLLGTLAFRDYVAIRARQNGLPVLRIRRWVGTDPTEHAISFPEDSYAADISTNTEFDSPTLRFSYTSLLTPPSVFEYNMATRERKLLKEQPVPGYDRSLYQTARIYAPAADGAKVPVAVVYRKGLKLDGSNPTLLTGYGSYGANSDASFSSNRLPLLDRGFVCAIAQIRGGSENGRSWYEDGRLMHKRNTFNDFIAAAEALIQNQYTSPDHLAIRGGSAGGLLMGAVVNMRPDLFRAVVADVPFVDVINTMLDPGLPLTVVEYDQWGNPNEKAAFDYIATYSPYDNVSSRPYPRILATAGLNDSNVPYWEAAKWVAKLRDNTTSGNPVLLRINMESGHGGASDRYKRLDEEAFRFAFICDQLGVQK
jgi:oligopeptidase B